MEDVTITVGTVGEARIVLMPRRQSHAGATDYGDGNWIDTTVVVVAGGFRGQFEACLRAEEFASFRHDLERLYQELGGEGQFNSMEEWVAINLKGDGRGHFRGICHLRDRAGDGNLLECHVEFDQTDIRLMVEELRAIEAFFPIIGSDAG